MAPALSQKRGLGSDPGLTESGAPMVARFLNPPPRFRLFQSTARCSRQRWTMCSKCGETRCGGRHRKAQIPACASGRGDSDTAGGAWAWPRAVTRASRDVRSGSAFSLRVVNARVRRDEPFRHLKPSCRDSPPLAESPFPACPRSHDPDLRTDACTLGLAADARWSRTACDHPQSVVLVPDPPRGLGPFALVVARPAPLDARRQAFLAALRVV